MRHLYRVQAAAGRSGKHLKFKSVRSELLVAFAVVAALLAGLGLFGVAKQSQVASKAHTIYKDNFVPVTTLAKVRAASLKSRVSTIYAQSRGELVATMYAQQYEPRNERGCRPGPYGWYLDDGLPATG